MSGRIKDRSLEALSMIYDNVQATTNNRLYIAIQSSNIYLIDYLGNILLKGNYGHDGIVVNKDIVELRQLKNNKSIIYKVTSHDGILQLKIIVRQELIGKNISLKLAKGSLEVVDSLVTVSDVFSKSFSLLLTDAGNELLIITKNGVLHNKRKYLHLYECYDTGEILGVKHLTIKNNNGNRHIHREVDILDQLGRVKRTVSSWDRKEIKRYGVTLDSLYWRRANPFNRNV